MNRDREEYRFRGDDDFLRLDDLCSGLLKAFYGWLRGEVGPGLPAVEATALAHAADRYLRDFLVDILETGPANADAATARQYLGNWYIVNTLDPTHREIDTIRRSLGLLYRYLAEEGILPDDAAVPAQVALSDGTHFHGRLEDFWNLTADSIPAWLAVDDYRKKATPPPAPRDALQ